MIIYIILLIFVAIAIYYNRHIIIYNISLLSNACINSGKNKICHNDIIVPNDDISGPANSLRLNMEWEPWLREFIEKYCDKRYIALDIGAHIGIHTLTMSKYAKQVIAFEPSPKTFEVLNENTKKHNNIKIYKMAVGNYTGTTKFILNDVSSLSQIEGFENVNVPIVDLDTFLDKETKQLINFIKIDVEGFEIPAFQGMKNIIIQNKPIIVFEDHTGDTCKHLQDNFNYSITEINSSNFIAIHKIEQ